MATISERPGQQAAQVNGAPGRATTPELAGVPPRATTLDWGNSAPLALFAFAVTTFMLSMVNADAIAKGVEPVGVRRRVDVRWPFAQLIAGIIRATGRDTFAGVFPASAPSGCRCSRSSWFIKEVPASQVGHAPGPVHLRPSDLRGPNVGRVAAHERCRRTGARDLVFTFFFLGAGNYGGDSALLHWGGYTGLAAAACAFYLAFAELCSPHWPGGRPCLASGQALTHLDHPKRAGRCRRA